MSRFNQLSGKAKQAIIAGGSAIAAVTAVGVQAGGAPVASLDVDGICTMAGGDVKGTPPPKQDDIEMSKRKNRYDVPEPEDDELFQTGSLPFGAQDEASAKSAWDAINNLSVGTHKKPDSGEDIQAQGKAFRLRGYVLEVEPGGVETCNCKQTTPEHRDVHIYVAQSSAITLEDKKAQKGDCIIAEVTPRVRHELGHDVSWSAQNLAKSIVGKEVEFEGWLFYDFEHIANGKNEKGKSLVWRATCWEIHPVTSIKVKVDSGAYEDIPDEQSAKGAASTAGSSSTTGK